MSSTPLPNPFARKPPRIGLVHATALAMSPIEAAFDSLWPEAMRMNLLDASLSVDRAVHAELQPDMFGRFRQLADYAVGTGCDALLFTCSAFGPAIEAVAREQSVPVLKPNEAMFELALQRAAEGKTRVALVATFEPSIGSMADEFRRLAQSREIPVEFCTLFVPEAMDDLARGEPALHHRKIAAAAASELGSCDTVMLAQFSMAAAQRDVSAAVPRSQVLSSPECAVSALKERVLGVA